jgi:hypothetical protein
MQTGNGMFYRALNKGGYDYSSQGGMDASLHC